LYRSKERGVDREEDIQEGIIVVDELIVGEEQHHAREAQLFLDRRFLALVAEKVCMVSADLSKPSGKQERFGNAHKTIVEVLPFLDGSKVDPVESSIKLVQVDRALCSVDDVRSSDLTGGRSGDGKEGGD
jgi:hypothetical protein